MSKLDWGGRHIKTKIMMTVYLNMCVVITVSFNLCFVTQTFILSNTNLLIKRWDKTVKDTHFYMVIGFYFLRRKINYRRNLRILLDGYLENSVKGNKNFEGGLTTEIGLKRSCVYTVPRECLRRGPWREGILRGREINVESLHLFRSTTTNGFHRHDEESLSYKLSINHVVTNHP